MNLKSDLVIIILSILLIVTLIIAVMAVKSEGLKCIKDPVGQVLKSNPDITCTYKNGQNVVLRSKDYQNNLTITP